MTVSVAYIYSLSMQVYGPYTDHDSHKVLQVVRPCCHICRLVLPLTSSFTKVYCMVPGCKGWHSNLASHHQKQ